jgi:hypothetical protein
MSIHYDEKGKIFTYIVSKIQVPAIIQTLTHRIHGTVHVRDGDRLIEELCNGHQFLAVTSAVVFTVNGKPLYRSEFLTINREHIVWLLPSNEAQPGESMPGGRS